MKQRHRGFQSTQKVQLAQEFLEARWLEAGKTLGRGTARACPVVVVHSRHLLSAAVENRVQSWTDTYLKLVTHLLHSYDPFKLCQWEAAHWRQMVVSGHLSVMLLM